MRFCYREIVAAGFVFVSVHASYAQTCPSYPNTLTNGTTADANAVMGNFNAILNCANNSLTPSSGGTLTNPNLNGTTVVQKLQFPDGTTQTTASSPLSVPVRQTVMGGPAAAGVPTFLPSTSSNLTLSAQNVSIASPLTVTAAQGFGATGASNYVYQFTTNPAWAPSASAISYLYVNAQTGATGSTTLVPLYQYGGTISTTNNKFTFDYQAMVGWMGNGSAAVATPLVFVGEATTSGSAVTASVAYAYNGYYESPPLTIAPALATYTSYNSNLGVAGVGSYDCTIMSAINGYSVGDHLTLHSFDGSSSRMPFVVTWSRNAIGFVTAAASSGASIYYVNKTTSVPTGFTSGSAGFSLKLIQRRGWGGA